METTPVGRGCQREHIRRFHEILEVQRKRVLHREDRLFERYAVLGEIALGGRSDAARRRQYIALSIGSSS